MPQKFPSLRGTRDLLPADTERWRALENTVHEYMKQWGYGEIRTPAFERTELFSRSVGEDTDIVSKQMYTFQDKSNTSLTLKPELTAPVMRAYIEHNLDRSGALTKLYYIDSLFRQERPQKGRWRQFHQFGAEAIGSPYPEQDAEIIALAYTLLQELGGRGLTLHLNSIGSKQSRSRYGKELTAFLAPRKDSLSETSQRRLETNPLRILDTKDPDEQQILEDAPHTIDFLDPDDFDHYAALKEHLARLDIPFQQNHRLIRGLDYYCRTTFEITSPRLGAQDALCGGGRYDDLIEELGGTPTPAVGFAAGIDRILLALGDAAVKTQGVTARVYVAAASDTTRDAVIKLAMTLRTAGLSVHFDTLRRSLKSQMRDANRLKCTHTVIVGDEELENETAQVKDLTTGEQTGIRFDVLASHLDKELSP